MTSTDVRPARHVPDAERRARLARRHALAPGTRVGSPEAATRAMTVLHASEPASVHLACWARVDGFALTDVEDALYARRTLVKQLAMRRTVFVLPRDLLPAVWPSAAARVAASERAQMVRDVVRAGVADDGDAWLDRARAAALAVLEAAPEGLAAADVRRAVPMMDRTIPGPPGVVWSAPRVLLHLGATGDVVRGAPTSHWRTSRPRWTTTPHWLGDVPAPWTAADGYRELVARWLRTFGPGTEDDVVWWLRATKGVVREAFASLRAVPVSLDGGGTGWVLPDDLEPVADPGPWAALLPVLDPTVMGWKDRAFYLGPHRSQLVDRNGNAGSTAWVDGRVVGCWVQDDAGTVRVRLVGPVPAAAARALDDEAERLTAWLAGTRVGTTVPSPAMRATTWP